MTDHQSQEHLKISKSFLAGGIAGAFNKTMIAPVDRIKYLFVTSNRTFTYRKFFQDLIIIVKNHGIMNLWRGNSMNIARMFPHSAIDFSAFDFFRTTFYTKQKCLRQDLILFFCGSAAGVLALTATDPLEFVRIRLAMQRSSFTYLNSRDAFKTIYNRQGFLGFYKGYLAAVLGVCIYQGFSFYFYTKSKEHVRSLRPEHYNKWYTDLILGGVSAFGQIVAYPLDILRKRMQGQALLIQKGRLTKWMSYRQLIDSIYYNQRGLAGFYKGVTLNLVKAPLGSASAWMIKNYLNRKMNKFYDF